MTEADKMDENIKIEMLCETCSHARFGCKRNYGFPIYCNFRKMSQERNDLCAFWKLSNVERQVSLAKKIGHDEYAKQLRELKEPEK